MLVVVVVVVVGYIPKTPMKIYSLKPTYISTRK